MEALYMIGFKGFENHVRGKIMRSPSWPFASFLASLGLGSRQNWCDENAAECCRIAKLVNVYMTNWKISIFSRKTMEHYGKSPFFMAETFT